MKTKLRVYISCRIYIFLTYKTMKTYCIVCKKDTENKNPKVFKTKERKIDIKINLFSV